MNYLFGDEGWAALERLAADQALLAFDFDGTLAPIAAQPDAAQLPPASALIMQRLCAVAPVAIITGRSVADVSMRLGFEPHYVIGNHGSEGLPVDPGQLARFHDDCQRWQSALRYRLDTDPILTGAAIEDKGLTLSLHYRHAHLPQQALEHLMTLIQGLTPTPRVVTGKFVVNLLPDGASTKHHAVEHLMATGGFAAALFAGDDETDEDVFRGAPPHWLTVRIEPVPTSAARYFLRSQTEVPALLERLVALY